MVTGSPQTKHKLYYACLNVYPDGKGTARKTKWIPTGLPERGNKRKAEHITDLLKPIFNRDGTLIDKYACACDPIGKIARDIPDLPEITLTSLSEICGVAIGNSNTDLQHAIEMADTYSPDSEQPAAIRRMLFCDYMVLWLERLSSNLDRGTYGGYKTVVHGRTYDFFRDLGVTVEELTPGHIEAFYRMLAKKHNLAPNSILHYHCNIRKALQQLYIKQTIPNNPADLITNRPVRSTYQAKYYNEEQANEYLQIVKNTKMELPVLFALFYGFRRSEAIGVKDTAINLSRRILTVDHTVTIANVNNEVEIIRKDRTKSRFSLRSMPLVDNVYNAVLQANERQAYYQKKLGSLYCTADRHYLCRDEKGELLNPNYVTAKHKALLEEHGLPHIRFHDLRHSCATMLLAKGVSLDRIKEWLGHSDIKMTMRYAHLNVSSAKSEMADIMDGLIDLG